LLDTKPNIVGRP